MSREQGNEPQFFTTEGLDRERRLLEESILNCIRKFEDNTGLKVDSVNYQDHNLLGPWGMSKKARVLVDVSIPRHEQDVRDG